LRLHSQACAQASRWLAERSGYRHLGQEAFLAGLLHDLGKFYLLQMLDELAARGGSPMPLSETLVVEVLDGMHVDQGCRLMEEWNLPEIYLQVAGRHHHEEFDGKASLTGVVRLANQACRKLGLGIHCNPEIILAVTPEAQTLGIGEIPLAELEIMLEDTFLAAQPVPPL
jgi:HD-like signal output (HDOD) protein